MQRGIGIAAIVILTAHVWAAPSTPAAEPAAEMSLDDRTVAIVNGERIWVEDLTRKLGAIHGEAGEAETAAFDIDQLVFRLTNDALIAQEARALGMHEEDPTADQVRRFREKKIFELYDREQIRELADATEEEIERRFEEQYRRVTVRTLTTYEKPEAEALLERIRNGEDILALIPEHSVDPYRLRDGLIEDLPRIDMQRAIANVAFDAEPGDIIGPVTTDIGWSIVRVESFSPADPELFESVRGIVKSLVEHEKAEELRRRLSARAQASNPVELDRDVVASIVPERLPDARLIPEVPDPEAIVARIGDTVVLTADEYGKALLSRWSKVRNQVAAEAAAPIVLQRMIDRLVLFAEALREGYRDRPEIRKAVHSKETELLVNRYLEEIVAADIRVDRERMRERWEKEKERYRKPPRLHLGQVTVETQDEAEKVAELLRGGADLAWVAEQHSIDRFKNSGGDRGWMTPTPGLDDFQDMLLNASPGEVFDPAGVEGNYIVMTVTARQEQGLYAYEEVQGNVYQQLFSERFQETLDAHMKKLRERSDIRVNDDLLAKMTVFGERSEASGDGGSSVHAP